MNLANQITMARVIMIPIFVAVYAGGFFNERVSIYAAFVIFALASFSDWLDGYIARSRNLITNFGKFADPLADKLLVAAALVCMVEKGLLPSWLVILILCREFIITAFRTVAVSENIVIAASWWGKVKTTVQLVMILLVMLEFNGVLIDFAEFALVWAAAFFTVLSGVDYIAKNKDVLKG